MSERFVNPYNFIPLSGSKMKAYEPEGELLTGVIDYTITARTPMFIPDTGNDHAFPEKSSKEPEHKSYDFFSYGDGVPVIPGSELRGMFRSLYETITSSCLSVLNGSEYLSRRIMNAFNPGLLGFEGDSLKLYGAISEKCSFAEGRDCKEGASFRNGYLIKGEKGFNKKSYHYFVLDGTTIGDADYRALEQTIEFYQEQNGEKYYGEYYAELKAFMKRKVGYYPVYYSIKGDMQYLSPAARTKEVSKHTIGSRVGKWSSCTNIANRCPACDLFGMVSSSEALSSSIRFADACLISDGSDCFGDVVTLQALGGPKPSNSEFYLNKPAGADYWSYDYYTIGKDIKFYPDDYTAIRGRKYYWHQPDMAIKNFEPSKLNVSIRPIKKETSFAGQLFFEGITEKQLNQLLWIVNGNELSEGDKLSYKIGMAKPLGYGSVDTRVLGVKVRKIVSDEESLGYKEEAYDYADIPDYASNDFANGVKAVFEKFCSFNSMAGNTISYPVVDGQEPGDEGFRWFGVNNKRKTDKIVLPNAGGNVVMYSLADSGFRPNGNGNNRGNNRDNNRNSFSNRNNNSGNRCAAPGCKNNVTINPNTGRPNKYCRDCFRKNRGN